MHLVHEEWLHRAVKWPVVHSINVAEVQEAVLLRLRGDCVNWIATGSDQDVPNPASNNYVT